MELDAEEAARLRDRDDALGRATVAPASPRRTSARSSRPRRRARPAPSRCAARGPRGAGRARPGRSPSPATPPSSSDSSSASWRPRQMPSVGAAAGDPLAERLVEPALAQPVHRACRPSRRPAARRGRRRQRRPGSVVARRSAPSRSNASDDRAHVPGAVLADRDVHTRPFVDGMPRRSRAGRRRAARGRPP